MVHASAIWILFMKHETLFSLIMRKAFSYSSCASSSISSYLSLLNITHISLPPQHHTHTTHTHTHTHTHTTRHLTPHLTLIILTSFRSFVLGYFIVSCIYLAKTATFSIAPCHLELVPYMTGLLIKENHRFCLDEKLKHLVI